MAERQPRHRDHLQVVLHGGAAVPREKFVATKCVVPGNARAGRPFEGSYAETAGAWGARKEIRARTAKAGFLRAKSAWSRVKRRSTSCLSCAAMFSAGTSVRRCSRERRFLQ